MAPSSSIDPASFERVRDLFAEVHDLPPEHRSSRLAELAGSDPPLHAAVTRLLQLSAAADEAGFLSGDPLDGIPMPTRRDHGEVPATAGPYRILERIGEGGTSVVHLAEAPEPLSRRVALKVSRAASGGGPSLRATLEAEVLASFNHPCIAQVFDTGTLPDGRRWTACELIEGIWISEAASAGSWRDAVALLIQAAHAVHHAHQRGVIHRDLKPSNLLVATAHGQPQLKVIDFGAARWLSPNHLREAVTEAGMLVGTLAYMSPEQLAGRPVDARTDVYGLGLVSAEVLGSGRPSGRDGTLADLTRSVEQPVRARLGPCGGRGRDLEAIIARATDPDPDRRYPSMEHLAEDLQRVIEDLPVAARRTGMARRVRLLARRHPWLVTAGTAATLLVTALLVALVSSQQRLREEVLDQRRLIGELVTDTLAGLGEIRGTSEQRQRMTASLKDRLERHLALAPDDPDLLLLRARLLRERGDTAAAIGRFAEAIHDLERSRDILESLTTGDAALAVSRLHAESMVRIGDVILERDRAAGVDMAMDLYRSVLAVHERLHRTHPEDLAVLDDLTWSYDRIGDVAFRWAVMPPEELERWIRTRLQLCRDLLAADPDRSLSRYSLATGQLRLAHLLQEMSRHEEAAAAADKGLEHMRTIAAAEPDRTTLVHGLIALLTTRIRASIDLGRAEEAAGVLSTLIETARSHARLLPGDVLAQGIAIVALHEAALMASAIGRPADARLHATEALETLARLREIVSEARKPELQEREDRLRRFLESLDEDQPPSPDTRNRPTSSRMQAD